MTVSDGNGPYGMTDPATTTVLCPACGEYWPEDRFNGKDPECFRCRARTVAVAWGPMGKSFWHDTTTKEFTEKTVNQARANGLDPVPVHSASVHAAGGTMRKLEAAARTASPKTESK